MGRIWGTGQAPRYDDVAGAQWRVEPAVGELVDGLSGDVVRFAGRVATGVPQRVHKLKGLGNAIVPAIAEWIGGQIRAAEGVTP
jgi:hypothetical protein